MPLEMSVSDKHINEIILSLRAMGDVIYLDSQKSDHPENKKSYIAGLPKEYIFGFEDHSYHVKGNVVTQLESDPFTTIDEFSKKDEDWLFGYLSYDLKNFIENLESSNPHKSGLPLFYFMKPEILIEIDNSGEFRFIKGDQSMLNDASELSEASNFISKERSIEKDEYIQLVKAAQDLIHEGDVYEINLSHCLEFEFEGDAFSLFKSMKEAGAVPFAAYCNFNDIDVCCASPERFLKRENDKLISQPIKGTIPNYPDTEISSLKSEKNLAENLMIVDLVRNDLNRIAKPDTVQVSNLFEIQSFETVHQLVSTIECEIESETSFIDIIKAAFPMGSMTGAPKIAAMQAIDRLENYQRGLYSGSIGYIKPDGDFDFNVVIRSAIIENNKLIYPVGGAITSDSIPEDEWEETLTKSLALKNSFKCTNITE